MFSAPLERPQHKATKRRWRELGLPQWLAPGFCAVEPLCPVSGHCCGGGWALGKPLLVEAAGSAGRAAGNCQLFFMLWALGDLLSLNSLL